MLPIAAGDAAWALLGGLGALAGGACGTWFAVTHEGSRTQYANETARYAAFEMAKRDVYAALLAAAQAYHQEPADGERERSFQRERARAMMHVRSPLAAVLDEELGPSFPRQEPDWQRLTAALRDDIS